MVVFALAVALLLLFALAAVLWPLLRRAPDHYSVGRNEANLQILRDQLAELDADLANGTLSSAQHENARAELERRVLDESQQGSVDGAQQTAGRAWLTPLVVGVLLPIVSVGLYMHLGSSDGIDVEAYSRQEAANITPDDVARMVGRLEQHLAANPDDVEGWAMLGRARSALQQFDASAQAWRRAAELQPDNADILTDYAEAVALSQQGSLAGEPGRLLSRALELEPSHPKGLALSGSAAFARGDYGAAIDYWQRLLTVSAEDDELSAALKTGIAEARSRLAQAGAGGQKSASVAGNVSLSPQLSQSVAADDTVFIFARATKEPGMPLAVARIKVSELPYQFRLDDSMAMTSERKLSDFEQLVIVARVSKSGSAQRASGDLEGFSAIVAAGASDVQIMIDQRVP